jgi:peroxiredoxin
VLLMSARLVLAAMFALAATAKLADRPGTYRSMVGFGIPRPVTVPSAWGLVASELAMTGLLCSPVAKVGAYGALALLGVISSIVAVRVIGRQTPDCHCFGRFSRGPVGWSTVARNACFMTIAGYVASGGQAPRAFLALFVVTGGLWLGLGPLPRRARRRGTAAPEFSLIDGSGATWTLSSTLSQGSQALLVFSHPTCGPCQALLADLGRWQRELAGRLRIVVINRGSPSNSRRVATAHGLQLVLADESGVVAGAYGVLATPTAVLIDDHGRSAATARGAGEISGLVTRWGGRNNQRNDARFDRRALLGFATLGLLPLVAAACGGARASPKRPKTLHVDGAYLCDQRYALCTDAACVPSPSDPSIVICDCVVKSGYAVGFKSCTERTPKGETLYSNFSTQLVTDSTRVLTCAADDRWANCLDVICTVDPHDSTKAHCLCLLVENGPSVTFGGDCDTKTCSSVIWSAATPNLPGSSQLEKGMKELGLPLTLPKACPSHSSH